MTEFKIKPQDFIALPTEARLRAIWEALPEACDGEEYPHHQPTCREALAPVADFLNPLPPKVQTSVLFGLSKWIRLELFEKLGQRESPEALTELVLSVPPTQTPFLIARIPPEKRIQVINAMKAREADFLVHYWCERYRRDIRVRKAAQRAEETADARGSSNEALLIMVQVHPFDNAIYAMELTRRVEEANNKGNGITLPLNKEDYADLEVENYSDGRHWTVRGFLLEGDKWRPFLFAAKKPAYLEELWVAGKLFLPFEGQKQLFKRKVFSWAREETLSRRKPSDAPDSFLGMTKLSLQRANHFFENRKVRQMPTNLSGLSLRHLLHPQAKIVTSTKPKTEFYFEVDEKRTLVIAMDEAADRVTYSFFSQGKDEAKETPITDFSARGLLPLLQSLPNKNQHVNRLIQKLMAISEYR